jgi:hypothetical protein
MGAVESLSQPAVFATIAALLGLAIGSFGSGVTCKAG